jgi:Fe-S cluster biosynthesis and repair protein YggX
MNMQQRIDNFKKMASDDPENELGHFSLGKAYLDAGQFEQARASFERVLQIKPDFSKAYQHLGEAQWALGHREQAATTLTAGYKVAAGRGDVVPREAMAALLRELGVQPPAVAGAPPAAEPPVDEHSVRCCRCGQVGPRLDKPPLKGAAGQTVYTRVCRHCWREWIGMGTKVINELRLDFSHPQAAEAYDAHMREFLQLPPEN